MNPCPMTRKHRAVVGHHRVPSLSGMPTHDDPHTFVFEPRAGTALPIVGQPSAFPVRRVYCVGRNYAEHAREMGGDPDREPPFFFTKPADAIVPPGRTIPYPPATRELHHEVELVVAVGGSGTCIDPDEARKLIFGYAVGLDLTRRDLQRAAKAAARPWAMAKGFDCSAPCSAVAPVAAVGHLDRGRIELDVNGEQRQCSDLAHQIWSPEETLAHLSRLVSLAPGDLVFNGTPSGVAALEPGDQFVASIEGVTELRGSIALRRSG